MLTVSSLIYFPASGAAQTYPDRPITIICAYAPGATTDLTIRALARGAEKLLGVPVVVENKAGGGGTVGAGLVASKKNDGYTLGVTSSGTMVLRPHILKVSYDPIEDFTFLIQYSRYIGGPCVLSESPIKTIDEFITYAKGNPGLSYGSAGTLSTQHLAVEALAKCKGLNLKHVPTKGGAESNTALLGKHMDFTSGAGQHITYVKQGLFRLLLIYNTDKRDPKYPNIPILKELGCEDVPPNGYVIFGPKNLPEPVCEKLGEVFKKVAEGPDFQKTLEDCYLPYEYKSRQQLTKDIPVEFEWYKRYLQRAGLLKVK